MEKTEAIPIADARLCLNCDNIIQSRICPICLSTKQIFIIQFIGGLKNGRMKRFVVREDGRMEAINIRERR